MKILIVAVNYNTYSELDTFLQSVEESLKECVSKIFVDIVVVDNSTKKDNVDVSKYPLLNIKVAPLDNLGYLGGAQHVINNLEEKSVYDYIAISNVDLKMDQSFLPNLMSYKLSKEVGWLAPSVFSLLEGRDKKTLSRPSKRKFQLLCLIFKYPLLFKAYRRSLYLRKRQSAELSKTHDIYSGHGAFILLTKRFFCLVPSLDFKPFLFCEENYFAELLRQHNLKCLYEPALKIWDSEHVSTGKINYKRICKLNYEAHMFIYNRFYR